MIPKRSRRSIVTGERPRELGEIYFQGNQGNKMENIPGFIFSTRTSDEVNIPLWTSILIEETVLIPMVCDNQYAKNQ